MLNPEAFWLSALWLVLAGPDWLQSTTHGQAKRPPNVDKLFLQLAPGNEDELRIKAAKKLSSLDFHSTSQDMAAIRRGLEDDNPAVRRSFLVCLCVLLNREEQPCPVELLKLISDPDPDVQLNAFYLLAIFDKFPARSLDRLLPYYESLDESKQAEMLMTLAKAAGKDKRVLKILFDAVNSDHASSRVNGTAAIWHATQDLEIVVPLYFDRVADYEDVRQRSNEADRFAGKRASSIVNLGIYGVSHVVQEHLAERGPKIVAQLKRHAVSAYAEDRLQVAKLLYYVLQFRAEPTQLPDSAKLPKARWDEVRVLLDKLANDRETEIARLARDAIAELPTTDSGR